MNVYFSGMIGSGKTTLGRRIAKELGWSFCDLDEEMNRILGYSFHRLVAEQGWLPFRELEYAICKDFAGRERSIVCLGGGTVRYQWNIDVLRGSGVMVLLEVSEAELVRRVQLADRPRVNSGKSLEQDIHLMWSRESAKYFASADLVYRPEGKPVDQEVSELIEILKDRGIA
ncbi:MAG TPA: shikimate kinase [Spirochaetia bacterium]|nr:shikimate kinase [Spirochaetia bacterium]